MASEGLVVQPDALLDALKDFVQIGRDFLENIQKEYKNASLHDFISSKKMESLFGFIGITANFNRLSVKHRHEDEDLWKNSFHCPEVCEQVEELLQLEVEWDAFFEQLDTVLSKRPLAESVPAETSLIDARSGEAVTLGLYLGKGFTASAYRGVSVLQGLLDAQSVRVLMVSFSCQEGARYWLRDTGCKYDMVLDTQKEIYSMFGLGSSYLKILKFHNLLKYAEYTVLKRTFPQVDPRIIDDIYQLGGDFVLNETGTVVYAHPCRSPVDRPSLAEILAVVNQGGTSTTH